MTLHLARDASSWVFIAVFKPRPSFSTDQLVSRLSFISSSLHRSGLVNSAVLKSLSTHSSAWAAVCSVWKKGTVRLRPDGSPAEVDVYAKGVFSMAHSVDAQWFEIHCWDCKDRKLCPQLSQKDIVHLRGIAGENDHGDLLSYSCLAILKAYFQGIKGLSSCSVYKSLHGTSMAVLGVWQNADAAYEFFGAPEGTPGESVWRSMGAKLRLGIYEVVFVITD